MAEAWRVLVGWLAIGAVTALAFVNWHAAIFILLSAIAINTGLIARPLGRNTK